MKSVWTILCWGLTAVATVGTAQTVTPDALFDRRNQDIVGDSANVTYTGAPAVLIEPSESPRQSTRNPAEAIPAPKLTSQNITVPIRTPFGHNRTAAFVDHTTDFSVLVQILNNQKIRIEEQIQFVNTEEGKRFSRTFPKRITTPNGRITERRIQVTNALRDKTPIPLIQDETDDSVTITYDTPLSVGIHRFTLSYLIENTIPQSQSVADILIDLTGTDWPLAVERFSALVLFPQKTTLYQKELLFGINNASVPDSVRIQTDDMGSVLYQLTRPLPAYADIRIHILADATAIPREAATLFNISSDGMAGIVLALILILYTAASVWVCRHRKWKKPLTDMRRISPLLWRIGCGYPLSVQEIEKINQKQRQMGQQKFVFKLLEKTVQNQMGRFFTLFILKTAAFIRFNLEYIIGVTLLLLATKWSADYVGATLSGNVILFGGILGVAALLIINRAGTRIELIRFQEVVKTILLNSPQGLNPAPQVLSSYYIISLCLGFGDEWADRLIRNNPAYGRLTFLRKEKQ